MAQEQKKTQDEDKAAARYRVRASRDDKGNIVNNDHVTVALVDKDGKVQREENGKPVHAHLAPGQEVPSNAHPDDLRSVKKHLELI